MKRKIFSILLALVLVLTLGLVMAGPAGAAIPTTIESSTMVFQSVSIYTLTGNPGGPYTGMIPMVQNEGSLGDGVPGFDLYARNGAMYHTIQNDIVEHGTIVGHEWCEGVDTPDWYQYSLNFYEEEGVQRWRVANHSGATVGDPWAAGGGSAEVEQGVPMSGVMDWVDMYATETDVGEYLPPIDPDTHPKHPHWAAAHGGGPGCWDMDFANWSEVVPLQFSGFDVEITEESGVFTVTLTPAPGPGSAVGVKAASEDAEIGISVSPSTINFGRITDGAEVPGSAIGVTNIGNVAIDVSAEITADTIYEGSNYFFTTALELEGTFCSKKSPGTELNGIWTDSELGLKPIAVNDSGSVSTKLVCPGSGIDPGETYTGTVVFWAVTP